MPKYGMSTYIGNSQSVGVTAPIFFDPHYPIMLNKPPVTLITGSPGSGKTFCGLTLASHASILGKTNIILDPKGDFVALKKMAQRGIINEVTIWNVVNPDAEISDENTGMLDPTSFTDNVNENTALTIDIIGILVGNITPTQKTALQPIVRDVTESETPSLSAVVRKIKSNRNDEIRSLAFDLETYLNIPLAKLLTTNRRIKKRKLELSRGTIVANLMGLKMPVETKAQQDYDANEKVSVCIMALLTNMILKVMRTLPKHIFKTLIVDEAWAITATKTGENMLKEIALLGRSKNMATILLTQSPRHIEFKEGAGLENTISSRFAFRNDDKKDNHLTVEAMNLDANEGFEEILLKLSTGMCLMQDCNGGSGIVQIMTQDGWAEMFNTNPLSLLN